MRNFVTFFLTVVLIFSFYPGIKAADIQEEQTTEKDLGAAQEKVYKKVEAAKETKRYKSKIFVSALQGYDNNVFLNSDRKEDGFSESIVDVSVASPLNGRWDVLSGVSAHDITYWDSSGASLVDTNIKLGFEGKLPADLTLTVLDNIELLEYYSNDYGEYVGNKTGLSLRQKLPNNFFHAIGYEYFYKNYSDRKALNGWGGESDKDRADNRNTVDYELGVYLKKAMLKVFGEYYLNDSNDSYLDYYKYDSRRFGASAIYLFADKLTGYASFIYQRRGYQDRTIPDDSTVHERDKTYIASASLFYDIFKNATLGVNYCYRQNDSNSLTQKYSGSITTLGLYCRF